MKSKPSAVLIIACTCCIIAVGAGQSFDASSMGMAGAYGAVARGVNALAWNPANLVFPRVHPVELNLIGFNLSLANSALDLNNYNRYFTDEGHNGQWDKQDVDKILSFIPDRGLQSAVDANINVMGLAVLSYGFSAEVIGSTLGIIPKAPAEMYLRGNVKEQYRLDDLDGAGFSALKLSLSAAQKIPFKAYFDDLGIGLALNYYRGIAMAEVQESHGAFYTGLNAIYYYGSLRGRTAHPSDGSPFTGKGFGLDLGAAGTIDQKFKVSLVFKNLFASINWQSGTEAFVFRADIDSVRIDETEDKEVTTVDTSYDIGSFSTSLPTVMHLGAAYQLKENWLVSLDVEQAFANRLGYSDQAELAIGTEYSPLGFLPLRAGLKFGGKYGGYSLGLGFGLHSYVFEFDLAWLMKNALWPTYAEGVATALNMKFLF